MTLHDENLKKTPEFHHMEEIVIFVRNAPLIATARKNSFVVCSSLTISLTQLQLFVFFMPLYWNRIHFK